MAKYQYSTTTTATLSTTMTSHTKYYNYSYQRAFFLTVLSEAELDEKIHICALHKDCSRLYAMLTCSWIWPHIYY